MAIGGGLEDAPDRIFENAAIELRLLMRGAFGLDQPRHVLNDADQNFGAAAFAQRDAAAAIEQGAVPLFAGEPEEAFFDLGLAALRRRQEQRQGCVVIGTGGRQDEGDTGQCRLVPAEDAPRLIRDREQTGAEIELPAAERGDRLHARQLRLAMRAVTRLLRRLGLIAIGTALRRRFDAT